MSRRAHEALAEECRRHPGVWLLMAMDTYRTSLPTYMPSGEFELRRCRTHFNDLGQQLRDLWVRYVG